jgi:hypothetical protein
MPYKHFYLDGQEESCNQQGKRTKWSEKQAGQELDGTRQEEQAKNWTPIV